MKTNVRLTRLLSVLIGVIVFVGVLIISTCSWGTVTANATMFNGKSYAYTFPVNTNASFQNQNFNPNPPTETVKLVFIHHSVGSHWLLASEGRLRQTLNDNNYYVLDVSYGWGPLDEDVGSGTIGDHTDIGYWYNWFVGIHRDTYLSALYTTNNNAASNSSVVDPGGENEIIMFKSCYPNSELRGEPDEAPTVGDNPLRGQSSSSSDHTVGNAKGIYNDILTYFETRQDKLFVVITAPPLIDDTYADNARAFNNWLVHDWLADYAYHNVAVFDFYNVLTTNGGDANTNDYGLSSGNHHRIVTTTTPIIIEHITQGDDDMSPNTLEYPTSGGTNDHPSSAGNQKATGEFVPLLNAYYNCWKYGQCVEEAVEWISVTTASDVVSVIPGGVATFTLSVTASQGFNAPVTLTLQGIPTGTTATFTPNPITPPAMSQLTLTTTKSTPMGTYPIVVVATATLVSDTVPLTLTAKLTLTLAGQPVTHAAVPGNTRVYTLSVGTSRGFSAPVAFALEGLPSEATATFFPNPVIPPGVSHLYITTTPFVPVGTYFVEVTADAGIVSTTANLTLTVEPTITLQAQPDISVIFPGDTATYSLTVATSVGFTGPVTFTIQGMPAEAKALFAPNPLDSRGVSYLSITTTLALPVGTYPVTVTATTGAISRATYLTLLVKPVLTLTVQPYVLSVQPGDTAVYTLSVAAGEGFVTPVTLTIQGTPTGTPVFTPNPVIPPGNSHLSIATLSSAPARIYPMTITAVTRLISNTVGLTLIVLSTDQIYLPLVLRGI
ncbi:MAG: hypothetical protein JXA33_01795 [Anaerolineae bacterium]|nr:hypothetical protein [Anaerolineae bacterium]